MRSETARPPRRREGVEEPPAEAPHDGLSKTDGGRERLPADDTGGMIGEAETGREGGMLDEG